MLCMNRRDQLWEAWKAPNRRISRLFFRDNQARATRAHWFANGVTHAFEPGAVVDWHRFTPSFIEYDFERDELAQHGITLDEAIECFFSDFQIRRNKRYYRDRYQLLGRTFGGRRLKVIFQLKQNNVVRIITGWPI